MIELKSVKYDPANLLVGRRMHKQTSKPWQALYLHEGKIYLLPVETDRFNACRDTARANWRNKANITINEAIHSPAVTSWDIYGAEDGWRMVFKYDVLAGQLTYTTPGKANYAGHVPQCGPALIVEHTAPGGQMAEPPLDPALSAPDEDFPLTMGADHHATEQELSRAIARILGASSAEAAVNDSIEEAKKSADPLADEIEKFPAYWRKLPANWVALDYYRVRQLFPLPPEFQSARLDHAMKKLLIPANRTGGKPFRKEMEEVYATIGQWLKDNPEN